jgi:RNA polymerase primary sigma factor
MSSTAFVPRDSEISEYLKDIDDAPLLTAEQERDLARRMAGLHSKSADVQRQARDAREQFIKSNLRLVVSIAKNHLNRGLPFLDLVEEGNLGLLHAVERFDPGRKCRFSTYATWWIRQAIQRAISNTSRIVRVPSYLGEVISKWKSVENELGQALYRKPDITDVHAPGGPRSRAAETLKRAIRARRLFHPVRLDALGPTAQAVNGRVETPPVSETVSGRVDSEQLYRHLRLMDKREASVLRLRYGLGGEEPSTLAEIAKELRVTRERVRQIERAALGKLQERFAVAAEQG